MACADVATAKAKATTINLIIIFSMCSFFKTRLRPHPGLSVLGNQTGRWQRLTHT
jgi:hypothetical protein